MAASTIPGMVGAVFDYVSKTGTGERAVGGSTITQQVAKNLLHRQRIFGDPQDPRGASSPGASNRRSPRSRSSSSTSTRSSSAGTPMACRPRRAPISTRTSSQLSIAESAFSPSCPRRRAITIRSATPIGRWPRRNWVLGEMARNGFITAAQRDAAIARAARHGARRRRRSPAMSAAISWRRSAAP